MLSTSNLRKWWSGSEVGSPAPVTQEIDDELLFHFRAMVDDNLAAGMPLDSAWSKAQARFGSFQQYSETCRNVAGGGRAMIRRLPVWGIGGILLLLAFVLFQVQSMAQQQKALAQAELAQAAAMRAVLAKDAQPVVPVAVQDKAAVKRDLIGTLRDDAGQPVAGAKLLVIRKTWPKGRYRQEDFHATSDEKGNFRLSKLVPPQGQFAFHVAAVKPGFTIASVYHLIEEGDDAELASIDLKLGSALPLTLIVKDAKGQAVPNAKVVPFQRQAPDGAENGVYFQASKPIVLVANEKGEVPLAYFAKGDEAKVYVQLPGDDWNEHPIQVPDLGGIVVVAAEAK